ncbi:hypothetical protein DV736_g700, partial [Chaetothyriales sp. CBS 134916]
MPSSLDVDMSDDFVMPTKAGTAASPPQPQRRTLLLSPPSLSSHQELLTQVLKPHDRTSTDLQMLDRIAAGLVSLAASTYDVVTILSDADASRRESQALISRHVLALLVQAMKPGAVLQSYDGQLGATDGGEKTEYILAGLTCRPGQGFVKPDHRGQESVPLRFVKQNGVPAGVGFDDGTDTAAAADEDDELIDEDTLLDEEDMARPVKVPAACKPNARRRRACKDCTCGLAEKIAGEDQAMRAKADSALQSLKLDANDLSEVDFTVKGKVGSCGNCSLGDAFRCDGCPYIGLPAFKPGEEVRLLNNDIQL